jgi:hypothetical protein
MKRSDRPTSNEVGKMRAHLARCGVPVDAASAIVKMAKTRGQIAADLIAYLKERGRGL